MSWFESKETEYKNLADDYKDMNEILKADKIEMAQTIGLLKKNQATLNMALYGTEKKLLSLAHLMGDMAETLLNINATYKAKEIYSEAQILEMVSFISKTTHAIIKNGEEYASQKIEKIVNEKTEDQ
jgi:hypothetical protein